MCVATLFLFSLLHLHRHHFTHPLTFVHHFYHNFLLISHLLFCCCCFFFNLVFFLTLFSTSISQFSVRFRFPIHIHNYRWSNFYYFGVNFPFALLSRWVCVWVCAWARSHFPIIFLPTKFHFFFSPSNAFFCVVISADSLILALPLSLARCLYACSFPSLIMLAIDINWFQSTSSASCSFCLIKCWFHSIATAADFAAHNDQRLNERLMYEYAWITSSFCALTFDGCCCCGGNETTMSTTVLKQ